MNKRGQALVEFILILPVLILLFFGAIDFGRIVLKKNELEDLTTIVIDSYKEGNSYEEITNLLNKNSSNNTLTVTNKNNNYVEFILSNNIEFITPGLKKILGDNYKIEVKRVIYYE